MDGTARLAERPRGLRTLDLQIHDDRLLAAAHHHAFARLIRPRVDLLMRHERRHEDEIAGAGLVD